MIYNDIPIISYCNLRSVQMLVKDDRAYDDSDSIKKHIIPLLQDVPDQLIIRTSDKSDNDAISG